MTPSALAGECPHPDAVVQRIGLRRPCRRHEHPVAVFLAEIGDVCSARVCWCIGTTGRRHPASALRTRRPRPALHSAALLDRAAGGTTWQVRKGSGARGRRPRAPPPTRRRSRRPPRRPRPGTRRCGTRRAGTSRRPGVVDEVALPVPVVGGERENVHPAAGGEQGRAAADGAAEVDPARPGRAVARA